MAKQKYPNPEIWRHKDNVDWKAQGENLKEVVDIAVEMFKETDWSAWKRRQVKNVQDFKDRVVDEYKAIAAMTPKERKDLLLNGEKHLGRLYKSGSMATVRRE